MKLWQILLAIIAVLILVIVGPSILSLNPDLKEGIGVGLAGSFQESGKNDLALSMCDWVLEDSPYSKEALKVKVEVLTETGNMDEALALQKTVVYNTPEGATPDDWNTLADLSLKSGDTGGAVDAYNMVEKYYNLEYAEDPGDPDTLKNRGMVLIKLQRYDEAIDCYNEMTEAEPENTDAWIGLGDAYLFKSLYDQGQLVDLYADLGRDSSARVNKYSMNSFESNRKAVEAYNKAVEIDPFVYPLISAKILGNYQKTIENYQDILENL